MQFHNRKQAGILLAEKLSQYTSIDKDNTIVIALPRGGVAIGDEIAKKLIIPLDILLVKKLGLPYYPELSIGHVSEENEYFYNRELFEELGLEDIDMNSIREQAHIKLQEIGTHLRQGKKPLILSGKDIILVDDGIVSGSTIKSAIEVLKQRKVRNITIATPVASGDVVLNLEKEVKEIVTLKNPNPIYSVGEWYENFLQVESEEVITILEKYLADHKNKVLKKSLPSTISS